MTQGMDPGIASLLQLIQGNMQPKKVNTDVAQYILANSHINFGSPTPVALGNPNKPSLLNRLVDILSRPNYAIANTFHAAAQQHNPLSAFWRGLEGKDKTTFSKFIKEDLNNQSPVVQGVGGFIGDVALDPTTYIGAGAIKSALKTGAEKTGLAGSKLGKSLSKAGELPSKPVLPPEHIPELTLSNPSELHTFSAANPWDAIKPKGQIGLSAIKATEKEKELLSTAADVVPSAAPKPKPEVALSDYEKVGVQETVDSVLKRTNKSKINLKDPASVNPNQQLLIWKNVYNLAKETHPKSPAKQFETAYQMLIHAEDHITSLGRQLRYWDGSDLKLSDIISELHYGKGAKTAREIMPKITADLHKAGNVRYSDPDVAQAIHNVRVRSSLLDSEPVKNAVDAVLREKNTLGTISPSSDAHLNQIMTALPAVAKRHAIDSGASFAGGEAAKTLARDTLKITEASSPQDAIKRTSDLIDLQLEHGVTNVAKINTPLTNSLLKELDVSRGEFHYPLGDKGAVKQTFLGRLFAWYGQKDLRPLTEQNLLTATNSAWLRAAAIKRIADEYPREAQLQAVRYAQGIDSVPSKLGQAFRTALENLFRGSGLTPVAWKGQSVVERSGILMERLNKHLAQNKVPFKFVKGKVKNPITGEVKDYSKGLDWLNSWQSWDIKDPLQFFNKTFSAVEQASHEKALFDEIGSRFGSVVRGNGYSEIFSYPYLKGYYFTNDIAKQIPFVLRDIDTFFTTGANSPFLKAFDKISRAWKFTVTLPNPSHHIHNLLGDAYMSWMAGVRGVQPYNYAAQILRTQRNMYQELNDLEKLVAVDAIPRAMGKTPDAKDVLFTNKSGHPFTSEQIYVAANKMGILPQAHIVEDIIGGNEPLTKFQPFGGHVRAKLEHFSEVREHFARIAHFVDVVRRSRGTDFESIFKKAGYEVRKWHPDYLTLTPFEKKFMRRLMPFYSWTRKAIPLIIESVIMSPGKTLAYPKFMQAMQTMNGIEQDRGNPFPSNELFPQWIRDRGVGPIFNEPRFGARDTPPGPTIINPSNPLYDIFGQFSDPLHGFGSMLTPAIRIPVEMLTGRQVYNGAPIDKGNFSEYIGNQLPYWPLVQSFTGMTPTGEQTSRAQKEGGFNTERFINWLTSAGIRGTGPYQLQA
jgi:hypothetical protein